MARSTMRRKTVLLVVACGLFAAGAAQAVPVKYVYGPGGRLDGQFENGIAIGYEYDAAGNITRRYVCQGACFVDGECWEDAAPNPQNACLACTPGTNDLGWTGQVGLACDDGNAATTGDVCDAAGMCAGVTPPPDPGGGDGCCRVHGRTAPPTGSLILLVLAVGMWHLGRRRR